MIISLFLNISIPQITNIPQGLFSSQNTNKDLQSGASCILPTSLTICSSFSCCLSLHTISSCSGKEKKKSGYLQSRLESNNAVEPLQHSFLDSIIILPVHSLASHAKVTPTSYLKDIWGGAHGAITEGQLLCAPST